MAVRSFSSICALALAAIVSASALDAQPAPAGSRLTTDSPTDAGVRARYELPASRYVDIDGARVHYVDEGTGPAIVLLHGSFASLRQWDGWAGALKRRYRVIRFDMPPGGLSDPAPGGDGSIEHKVALIDALVRRLDVDRFVLVATSSGGYAGAAYAAEHGDRLTGLVMNNTAYGPLPFDASGFSPALKAALADDATHKGYHLPEYWRQILLLNFADPARLSPALVQEWTDLNNRVLAAAPPASAPAAPPSLERTPGDVARITVPTLLLWSADDHETTLAREGRQTLAALAAKDKALVVIPRCGHMMPMECGAEGLALTLPFLDRVTRAAR